MQNLITVCHDNNISNFDEFPKYENIYNQALEDLESKIKEYCDNDVIATEAAFNYLSAKM